MTYEPMPSSDYKARFYHSYYSTHLVGRKGQATLEQFALRGRMYDASWSRPIPTDRGAVILDVGCGTGSLVWWLQQRGYAAAEGIDVSAEQIEIAARLGVHNVAVADLAEHVGERPGRYDILILRDVLERLERPRILQTLDLCREALRPGGVLLVQVPTPRPRYGAGSGTAISPTRSRSRREVCGSYSPPSASAPSPCTRPARCVCESRTFRARCYGVVSRRSTG
jgi:2-polyprenyl-3-methyl-5-hydroxy-6-metoxy-1,4-benzoquinol methylase